MQRRLCEMSEAKCSITEAKCLQISHNKYASQRDAISPPMDNLMLSHSAGMQHPDISIAGICPNKFERAKGSKRFHFASLHYIFSAYLPTHIKFLTEFHRIFFGTTCISFPLILVRAVGGIGVVVWRGLGTWMLPWNLIVRSIFERSMANSVYSLARGWRCVCRG